MNHIIIQPPIENVEPYQPGLIIETSNPQTNEGIHKLTIINKGI